MKQDKSSLLTLFAAIAFFLYPQFALAQDCGSMIRDDAGMFASNLPQVTRAAEALQNTGAQVYLRTFPTTGDEPTAARLEHSIESHCADWQAANGGRKENLIAIIYADRDANGKHSITIATGGRIDSIVPATEIDRIRAQVIIPELKRGHAEQTFADGLYDIRSAYEKPPIPAAPQAAPAQQPAMPSEPGSFIWLWFLMAAVGVGVLGRVLYQSRQEQQRRHAARTETQQVYNGVTAQINAIEENKSRLQSHYEVLSPNLPADERQKIEAALARTSQTYDDACADFGTKRTSDLEKGHLSVDEYDALRETYQGILDKLTQAAGLVSETQVCLNSLQAQIESAPQKIQETQAAVSEVLEGLRSVKQGGFRTETYETLAANAQTMVNQANEALRSKLFFEALARAGQAKELLEQACQGTNLPARKAELENGISSLQARIGKAKSSILACKPAIERMDAEFARQSFASVAGNGSQATEHVNWCDRGVPMAADFTGMEKQDWQKAADIIAEANGHLDRVDSLVSSIAAMEKSLNTAKQGAPQDIQNAEHDLRAAEEYIAGYKNDLRTETGTRLAEAREAIAQSKAELQKEKPDYFEATNAAKKAHSVADEVLAGARTEHEAAERLRQKAETALRDADSRVSKASEYIEDHHRYAAETTKGKLQEAEHYLASAQQCNKDGDLDGTVKWAELADESGKTAYNQAREDVATEVGPNAYSRANHYYAPSVTTIFVNESSDTNYVSVGAGSHSDSSSSGSSSWFGGGSDSSSSFSSGGGSDSSSSFSSGGGSDSSSSW